MRRLMVSLILVLAAGSAAAQATTYPVRPITMVVPFAPGGPTDTVARVTAETMGRLLGQQVVVENVTGAGGTIGTQKVARAAADGYTVLLHHLGLATSVALYRKLPFDPKADLLPVGVVSDANMVFIARPDYPAGTFTELVADAKARGQAVSFGHSGLGAASQLCGMLFMAAIQKPLNTIPYRGGGPVIQALAGSQVDIGCEQATTAAPLVAGKRVKGYAVSRSSRLASLPELPTAAEAGLKGFDISVWHGLYVPAGTPPAIVQALSKALAEALKDPMLAKRFNDISTEATPDKATPQALRDLLHSEIDRWTPLIRAAGEYAD